MPTPRKIQSFSDLFLSGLWKTLWIVLITPVENCGKAEKSNGYVTCAPRRNGKWNKSMPAAAEDSPAAARPSPLINAGGRNGAQRPRLPLWGSWHGAAVTEEAFPAAA